MQNLFAKFKILKLIALWLFTQGILYWEKDWTTWICGDELLLSRVGLRAPFFWTNELSTFFLGTLGHVWGLHSLLCPGTCYESEGRQCMAIFANFSEVLQRKKGFFIACLCFNHILHKVLSFAAVLLGMTCWKLVILET